MRNDVRGSLPAWKVVISLAAIAVVVAGVFVATRRPQGAGPAPEVEPSVRPVEMNGETVNHTGQINLYAAREREFELETGTLFFNPSLIVAPPNAQMIVELENEAKGRHTFTAPGLGVDRELVPQTIKPFLIRTPGPGTYEFFCRYHGDLGMRGVIRVGGPPRT